MEYGNQLAALYQHALEYRFGDFEALFKQCVHGGAPDAWLMRAQIRLFTADAAFMEDLDEARRVGGTPRLPCLYDAWLPDSANRFQAFGTQPGALQHFLGQLQPAAEAFAHWYGAAGRRIPRQIESEIRYYLGDCERARALAEEQLAAVEDRHPDAISARYTLLRCHIARGEAEKAQQCMLDSIRLSREYPALASIYKTERDWFIATTAWSGDMPRYSFEVDGAATPILEERLAAVREGICTPTPAEDAFIQYAAGHYGEVFTVRRLYLEAFNAIHSFQMQDYPQAAEHFQTAYRISNATGLISHIVEYGRQILPLLEYMKTGGTDVPPAWVAHIASLAARYEDNLEAYRD